MSKHYEKSTTAASSAELSRSSEGFQESTNNTNQNVPEIPSDLPDVEYAPLRHSKLKMQQKVDSLSFATHR